MAPSSGVELALGICYEGLGKTASAWAAYEQAVSLARRDNRQDRERAATSKAAALEPKLSRATITVPDDVAPLPGLEVKEDDIVIGAAAWKDSPIDPGTHKLEVAATGKKPWSTTFTIEGGGATKSVPVPELEDKPAPPPPKESEQVVLWEQRTPNNPLRTAAYVAIGAGAVTLVAASILGGVAISDASDVHKTCPNPTCTDSRAVSENDTAGSLADWSTVLFVVSGVCLAAGVVLFFIRPPASTVKRTTATVAIRSSARAASASEARFEARVARDPRNRRGARLPPDRRHRHRDVDPVRRERRRRDDVRLGDLPLRHALFSTPSSYDDIAAVGGFVYFDTVETVSTAALRQGA